MHTHTCAHACTQTHTCAHTHTLETPLKEKKRHEKDGSSTKPDKYRNYINDETSLLEAIMYDGTSAHAHSHGALCSTHWQPRLISTTEWSSRLRGSQAHHLYKWERRRDQRKQERRLKGLSFQPNHKRKHNHPPCHPAKYPLNQADLFLITNHKTSFVS